MDKKVLYKPFVSKAKNKKYSVYVKSDNKSGVKLINFGAAGMDDWRSGTATASQRKSFRARMKGVKKAGAPGGLAYRDKTSPAYWALNYLW